MDQTIDKKVKKVKKGEKKIGNTDSIKPLPSDFGAPEKKKKKKKMIDDDTYELSKSNDTQTKMLLVPNYLALGNTASLDNEYANALEHFKMALKQDPTNFELLYRKGVVLTKLDRIQEATNCYGAILILHNDDSTAESFRKKAKAAQDELLPLLLKSMSFSSSTIVNEATKSTDQLPSTIKFYENVSTASEAIEITAPAKSTQANSAFFQAPARGFMGKLTVSEAEKKHVAPTETKANSDPAFTAKRFQ